jgi:hypothetical protein
MSDTPRTDRMTYRHMVNGKPSGPEVVEAKYARQLERELSIARKCRWQCRLDGKHGSQEVWECVDCKQEFYGNPQKACTGQKTSV